MNFIGTHCHLDAAEFGDSQAANLPLEQMAQATTANAFDMLPGLSGSPYRQVNG